MDPTKRGFGLGKGERREGAGQRGEVGGREKGLGRGRAMRREVRAGLGRGIDGGINLGCVREKE